VSRRTEQLGASLRREVQAVIDRGLQDPRIGGLITVTGVRVTPDRRHARVDVSVYPAEKQELTMHGLRSAAAHIRREVGDRIRTRQMPEIDFHLDESLKKQASVIAALARAAGEGRGAPPEGRAP
jgi:ribosome-binding factor A